MLPIYICEDEKEILELEADIVKQHIMIHNYDMQLALATSNPEEIVSAVKKHPVRGIYFFDVDLKNKQMDGFLLGKEIRKYDTYGFISYVTSFRELAYKTFEHHIEVLDYIVKDSPDGIESELTKGIGCCIDTVVSRMEAERTVSERACFTLHSHDCVRHIPLDEILFFETTSGSHKITLHTIFGHLDFIGQMRELTQSLPEYFFRCHRGYLVNLNQVKEVNRRGCYIVMKNGESCLVSRNLRTETVKRLENHIL